MVPAIVTKFVPASSSGKTPARYKAARGRFSTHVPASEYPTAHDASKAAVRALLARLKLSGVYYAGTLQDGRLVFVEPDSVMVSTPDLAMPLAAE